MAAAAALCFAVCSLALGLAVFMGADKAWRLQHHPVDYAMRILSSLWLLYLLICTGRMLIALGSHSMTPWPPEIESIACGALLAGLAFFLLAAAGAARGWALLIVGLGVLCGFVVTVRSIFSHAMSPVLFWISTGLNVVCAAAVTASAMQQVRLTNSWRSWLALSACVMGIGLWLHQVSQDSITTSGLPAVFHFYAFLIFVIWKLVSLNPDSAAAVANAGTPFAVSTVSNSLNSISTNDGLISLALRAERQRISHELHDNIGSQIVSLLFTMQAAKQPSMRSVMLSLEQCLAELKMTVDALDSVNENVTQAMGRLRYRVQPALDRQGIQMHWDVEMSSQMDAIDGVYAQQVLRIAQESLGNVMRHANAGLVKVSCCFVPEFSHLLLEVSDNGAGIQASSSTHPAGRGLQNMKRRAAAVGGFLNISNHGGSGRGTSVLLTLPLPHMLLRTKKTGSSPTQAMVSTL